jgi:biopolymer transport protein ExbB/TolQ
MVIEVGLQEDGDEQSVVLDLGYWHKRDSLRKIPWWKTNGVARTNQIVRVRPEGRALTGWFMKDLSFPTNPSALVAWIRSYWAETTRKLNEDYGKRGTPFDWEPNQLNIAVCGELERVLNQDLGHVQSAAPVVGLHVFNGYVQLLTFAAFFAALLNASARWFVFVRTEYPPDELPLAVAPEDKSADRFGTWAADELDRVQERHLLRERDWGAVSATLLLWRESLRAFLKARRFEDVPAVARDFAELEQEKRSSSGFNVRFLVGAMPALGFIGTVVGISNALLGTGSVLSNELAKQQSGVSHVALQLGFGFHATFVALVLTLVATFLTNWFTAQEEELVLEARRRCLLVLRPAGAAPPPPDGDDPPPAPTRAAKPPVPVTRPPAKAPPAPTPSPAEQPQAAPLTLDVEGNADSLTNHLHLSSRWRTGIELFMKAALLAALIYAAYLWHAHRGPP